MHNLKGVIALAVTSVLSVLLAIFFVDVKLVIDFALLFPLLRAFVEPGTYPAGDILVAAGVRGAFHFYHLLAFGVGHLNRIGEAWLALYAIFLFFSFCAYGWLGFVATGNVFLSLLTLPILALAPFARGTLNASFSPYPGLISQTGALPFALLCCIWVMRGSYALACAALVPCAFFHPGFASILFCVLAYGVWRDSKVTRKNKIWLSLLALGAVSPLFMILLEGKSDTGALSDEAFLTIFRLFSDHAYLDSYLRQGYGWFILGASLAVDEAGRRSRTAVTRIFQVTTCLMVLYVVNLYVFKIPVWVTTFHFRSTVFLRPLIFALGLSLCSRSSYRAVAVARVLTFILSACVPSVPIAETLLLGVAGSLYWEKDRSSLLTKGFLGACLLGALSSIILPGGGYPILISILCGVSGGMVLAHPPELFSGESLPIPRSGFAQVVLILLFGLTLGYCRRALVLRSPWAGPLSRVEVSDRFDVETAPPRARAVMEWFRKESRPRSLVLLPPLDESFYSFRNVAQRGVYIQVPDINQLSYDRKYYGEGYRRLTDLGIQVSAPQVFDASGYSTLSAEHLCGLARRDKIDYAVFPIGSPILGFLRPITSLDGWGIVDLKDPRAAGCP